MNSYYQYNIFNNTVPTEPIMDNTKKSKKIIKQKSFKKVHFAESITLEYTYSSDIYDRTPFEDSDYEMDNHTIQKPIVFNSVLDDIDFEIIYNNRNDVRLTFYDNNSENGYVDDDQDSVIDFNDLDDFDNFDDYSY
ncbi:hypothetical protein LY90DRAFT_701917 [Neocallimastix californiae]|uniref:Uncharacterized protein n=1 Tax=Neocallimastix californiae TaxID=1754190 RepID=A0A1Y2DBJ3_9FUNG|nr:hypothetical protein LY90DRAFT_701917 [Neocallimastix californiae]|eukprot:ORY56035.1 hypothetical protein LY90DRAFT_701917 [Neocallimastix californiae]